MQVTKVYKNDMTENRHKDIIYIKFPSWPGHSIDTIRATNTCKRPCTRLSNNLHSPRKPSMIGAFSVSLSDRQYLIFYTWLPINSCDTCGFMKIHTYAQNKLWVFIFYERYKFRLNYGQLWKNVPRSKSLLGAAPQVMSVSVWNAF